MAKLSPEAYRDNFRRVTALAQRAREAAEACDAARARSLASAAERLNRTAVPAFVRAEGLFRPTMEERTAEGRAAWARYNQAWKAPDAYEKYDEFAKASMALESLRSLPYDLTQCRRGAASLPPMKTVPPSVVAEAKRAAHEDHDSWRRNLVRDRSIPPDEIVAAIAEFTQGEENPALAAIRHAGAGGRSVEPDLRWNAAAQAAYNQTYKQVMHQLLLRDQTPAAHAKILRLVAVDRPAAPKRRGARTQ